MFALVSATVIGLFLLNRLMLGYPRPADRLTSIGRGDAAFLDAAASILFPAGDAMPLDGGDAGIARYMDDYLAQLPLRQRRLIRALFVLFEQSPLIFPARGVGAFRRFSSLSKVQQEAFMRGWAESPYYLRRTAFLALKAVMVMGYLGHEACLESLGLTPFNVASPICEADLLYPEIGQHPDSIPYGEDDLEPQGQAPPLRSPESVASVLARLSRPSASESSG